MLTKVNKGRELIFIVLLILIGLNKIEGQEKNQFQIVSNVFRFSQNIGIRKNNPPRFQAEFINGFGISYENSKNWIFEVGFRKLVSLTKAGITSHETVSLKGVEIDGRVGYKIKLSERIRITSNSGLFVEISKAKGTSFPDYSNFSEINHRRIYFGLTLGIQFELKLANKIFLFSDSRIRYGRFIGKYMDEKFTEHISDFGYVSGPFPDVGYWRGIVEPLNSLGLRYSL